MAEHCEMKKFENEKKRKEDLKEKLNKDVSELTDIIKGKDGIGEKIKDYCKEISKFEERKSKIEKYSKTKTPMIEAAIKDKKAAIEKKIKEYDENITNIQKEITGINKEITVAEVNLDTSERNYNEQKKTYDSKCEYIEGFKDKIDGDLKKMEGLMKDIEEYDKNIKTPEMYFLILELNNILKGTTTKKVEELESEFYGSWKNFDDAKKDKNEKEDIRNIAKEKLENKKQKLEDLIGKRKEEILKRISENGQQGTAKKPAEELKKNMPEAAEEEPK